MMRFARSSKLSTAAAVLLLVTACASGKGAVQPGGLPRAANSGGMGRSELWSAQCSRCHNLRPPSEFGPAQWEAIVNQMRGIAGFSGSDYQRLLEYLAGRARAAEKAAPPAAGGTTPSQR